MAGILAIALKRSAGVYVLPLLIILEVMNALARDAAYAVDWLWASSWSASVTILIVPVVAAAAAAESIYMRRRGVTELFSQNGVKTWPVHVVRAFAMWVSLAHLAGVIMCWFAAVVEHGGIGPLAVGLVLPVFLLLLAAVSLGMAVGWWVPVLALPPLLGVALYVVPAFALLGPETLFTIGGATGALVGYQYRTDILWAQSVWFLAVAAVCLIVLGLGRRARLRFLTLSAAGVVAVGAWVQLSQLGMDTLEPAPMAMTCNGGNPEVCVAEEYPDSLSYVRNTAEKTMEVLRSLGVQTAPERVLGIGGIADDPNSLVVPSHWEAPYVDAINVSMAYVQWLDTCHLDGWTDEKRSALAFYIAAHIDSSVEVPPNRSAFAHDEAVAALDDITGPCSLRGT